MSHAVRLLLAGLGMVTVLLVVGLFASRLVRERRQPRVERRRSAVREVLLTALLGDLGESAGARADLRRRTGSDWDEVEELAFAMAPKIRGDAREHLVSLLLSRGAERRATLNARSGSVVRRARGAYQLGVLGQRDSVRTLLDLLRDQQFLVRRLALRALGQVGDPIAVTPMLEAAQEEPELTRDATVAVVRIGSDAAAVLRRELALALRVPERGRRGRIAARALGMLGDVAAVSLLVGALSDADAGALRVVAAEALGEIGSPDSVPALLQALDSTDPDVQVAAGRALGAVGDPAAVDGLERALGRQPGHDAARAVAGALRRIGGRGMQVLDRSDSPYAAEALALHGVRQGV